MNKVILMGRLTRDPELRYTSTANVAMCRFTIAVDRRFSRQGEAPQTDFINIVAWRHTAEFVNRYFKKGLRVAVVGRLQTRSWDDDQGKRHWATDVVADETYFADGKRDSDFDSGAGNNYGGGYSPNNDQNIGAGFTDISNDEDGFYPMDDDDDLPF